MAAINGIWQIIGRQYEVLVYERSRLLQVEAQRQALKIDVHAQPDTNLNRKIELTEQILAALAELKTYEI